MQKTIVLSLAVLFAAAVSSGQRPERRQEYVANEILIKFGNNVGEAIERQIGAERSAGDLKLSQGLNKLNGRYRIRRIEQVFKGFKNRRERLEGLTKKDKGLLTKKEKHILRRLKRAPKGARVPDLGRIYKIVLDLDLGQPLEEAVEAYNRDPDVEYAELNYIVSINLTPNDPLYPIQWPLNNTGQLYPPDNNSGAEDADIDAPEAWDVNTGSLEAIVAVIDSGVDYEHRDMDDNMWINSGEIPGNGLDDDGNGYIDDIYGYDFCTHYKEPDSDPIDDCGHGTHCAGTIAAEGNNGLDVTGVCWNAKIMALKFLDWRGEGFTSDAVVAFYYAVENGADVISNSWGSGAYSKALEEAVSYAHSQGVVMVASAGNDDTNVPEYPAYYDHVISVAATSSNDQKASFSNYGDWVDIAAPGVDILSLLAGDHSGAGGGIYYDNYTTIMSGTSMACPHVAGACALMLSLYPEIQVDELKEVLLDSTDPISPGVCASGRLNLHGALAPKGTVFLDRELYCCSGLMEIKLFDTDIKGNTTQEVTVSTSGGDLEIVLLAEANSTPGVFGATIALGSGDPNSEDGTVQVAHNQILTVTYDDANDGSGSPATVTDTAGVDCELPEISNVQVTNIASTGAWVAFETDEPTIGRVLCAQSCGGPNDVFDDGSGLKTSHSIYLSGLTYETEHYLEIHATDVAGNETIDSNNAQCYIFITHPKPPGLHVPSEYPTIQTAIDATVDGNTVWVADGIYTGLGNRDIDFKGKAITLRSELGPENCIIDCMGKTFGGKHRGFYFHESEDANSILQGFTIVNGYVVGVPNSVPDSWTEDPNHVIGGGIYCEFSSPTIIDCAIRNCRAVLGAGIGCVGGAPDITNCTIEDCLAGFGYGDGEAGNGAGIGLIRGCNATITNCTIRDNAGGARSLGGGLCCYDNSNPHITGCTISGNSAMDKGGGICCHNSSPKIEECIISDNYAPYAYGGGVYCDSNSNAALENCIISENVAFWGGAMYDFNSSPTLTNCTISANYARGGYGGAIYDCCSTPTITNCVFVGNSTIGDLSVTGYGGAVFSYGSNSVLTNCTFSSNLADNGEALACDQTYYESANPSTIQVTNCILWDGGNEVYNTDGSTITITYSDIRYGWPGTGNIDADPRFVKSPHWNGQTLVGGDFHLQWNSPCADAGDPNGDYAGQTDMDGEPRVMNGRVDMGADELNIQTPIIHTSAIELDFSAPEAPNPDPQILRIRNSGLGALNWQISYDCSWLQVDPPAGQSIGEYNDVVLSVEIAGLSPGFYSCLLTITAAGAVNSPETVQVNLLIGGTIRYVPTPAYSTIQAAIDATENNDMVMVADGLYFGHGNRDIDFHGKAITVKSQNGPANCVIQCQGTEFEPRRGFHFHSGEDACSVVQGFTITSGYAGYGGGIYNDGSSPTIAGCVFVGNTAGTFGGGISNTVSSPTVVNCIFSGNSASYSGGMDNWYSSPTVRNCVFAGNNADNFGGAIGNCEAFPTIIDCILWADVPDEIYVESAGAPDVTYCDVEGGWSGEGNVDVEPMFADAAGGDFHLLAGSPAVDLGDPSSEWAQELWPNGGRVNMGAYGNTSEATRSRAGYAELMELADNWLTDDPMIDTAPEPDGDGIVNLLDYAVLAECWLWEQ